MLKKNISKIKWHAAWLLLPILLFCNPLFASSSVEEWLEHPVSLKFHEEPRDKVLEKISSQTGIAILYDQELANEKVTGSYKDLKVSDAISRLFRDKNKSIQVSKDEKVIIVKTFGAKNFILAGTVKNLGKPLQVSLMELEKLHALQYKEYKERITNDNELISEVGMTRGELRAMHKQQHKDHQAQLANDDIILEGGITLGELRTMHERQYKESQQHINNNDILEDINISRSELRAMHKQQYQDHQAQITNDNTILEGGITLGDLRTMHEQQYKEHNQ